jgi:hypothetical protein
MLFLITGTVGTGKTAYAVTRILEYRKKEPARQIYTNIDGINIPDVIFIEHNDYEQFDDGSIFFFDEAQQFLNFKASHEAKDDKITQSLQVSRHRGFDIYFITQHPSFLSKWVTCLINEHYHLVNSMGLKASTLYRFTGVKGSLVNLDVLKNTALDVNRISFDNSVFSKYKSATVHTKKFIMPKKLKFYIFLVFLLFGCFFYLLYYNQKNSNLQKVTQTNKKTVLPTSTSNILNIPASATNTNNILNIPASATNTNNIHSSIQVQVQEPFIKGCIIFDNKSFAYLNTGVKVEIKVSECQKQMHNMPVIFPLNDDTKMISNTYQNMPAETKKIGDDAEYKGYNPIPAQTPIIP